ncbi:hypothetical protein [Homoserinimonas sp. OAct 916]|uniref:hypothetical protein n=1 Tax=Homoserinimonas sp. OAct 916 TaxID=2211450 RepID=UPI001300AEA1|nr:hypothetical protein [Homoserinimonas sp. OAct 916]
MMPDHTKQAQSSILEQTAETTNGDHTAPRPSHSVSNLETGPRRILQRIDLYWLGSTFALLTVLAFLFPLSGDDWAWGSQIGIDRLDAFFENYNGRYVGNLIVLALTRLPLIAPFVVAATFTSILFLILDISKNRTAWGYAITSALLLAMPNLLWNQTISWLSGFVNYALSTLLVLIFARAVQADWLGQLSTSRPKIFRVTAIVSLAFLAAQFMENVTVFFVAASLILLPLQRLALGKVSADAWGWAAGFLAGAIAMFSNEAYQRAFGGDEGYQQVSGIQRAISKLFGPVSQSAIIDNLALNVALASAVILLGTFLARSRGWGKMLVPTILIFAFIAVAFALNRVDALTGLPPSWRKISGIAALLLLAGLFTISGSLSKSRKHLLLACIAAMIMLVGPLAFVDPIGPRLFLVTYAITLVIVNLLFQEVAENIGRTVMSGLAAVAMAVTVGLLCSYFVIYISISAVSADRLSDIRQHVAAGEQQVVVPKLPFPKYVHAPDPTEGVWATRYKLFYHLPPDLTIQLK